MKYVYLKQKVFAIRDTFKVFDEQQTLLYEAKGKILTLNSRRDLFQAGGTTPILTMKQKILAFAPTYFLFDKNEQQIAKMAQQLLTFFGTKFHFVYQGKKYELSGDFFGFNYMMKDEQGIVLQIQKKFLSWGDTYQLGIEDSFDQTIAVGIVLMIDDFIDDARRNAAASAGVASQNRGSTRGGRR
jgi:uncharacterized protein YxjI